ncbi:MULTISPECIES: glutathione S-transferase family protein [Moorena]|uniref:glutathione S-transferase family protein n=1 Tax=Moorena TaxID=1155738 RepID=UPI001E2E4B4C|nr:MULTISPECIES: glutathione S-transferase N-terminal domain-containing protein [Moorena]
MARILYYHQQSNFYRKIRILLAEKKIDCELKEVNLKNKPSEFIKVSPIGKVPVFVE